MGDTKTVQFFFARHVFTKSGLPGATWDIKLMALYSQILIRYVNTYAIEEIFAFNSGQI